MNGEDKWFVDLAGGKNKKKTMKSSVTCLGSHAVSLDK
jgi:hypothetical protein